MRRLRDGKSARAIRRGGAALALALAMGAAPLSAGAAAALTSPPVVIRVQSGADTPEPAELARLWEVLRLSDLISVMSREGRDYGASLGQDMFPQRAGAIWDETVARIHDPARMQAGLRSGLARQLQGVDLAPMLAFFDTPEGRHIIGLEISAREAMLDETLEEASADAVDRLRRDSPAFFNSLEAFIAANDLIESNVAGAMNSTVAFYSGLAQAGEPGTALSEAEILADVWAQEPDIRADTETWVYGYLAMAYQPLPEGQLADYTRFSRTDAGRALNAALFAAFDTLFVEISRELGEAAAARMIGEDL